MTDTGRAFLRAICANPDDDLPRLIFADWLDEYGESARAEFVRLQCKLARYDSMSFADCPACECEGHGYAHADDCPRSAKHPLRRREREFLGPPGILAPRMNRWLGFAYFDGLSVAFRRGFVAAVTLAWPAAVAHLDAILDAAPVTSVTLTELPRVVYGQYRGRQVAFLEGGNPAFGVDPVVALTRTTSSVIRDLLSAEWPRITTWNLSAAAASRTATPAAVTG